MKDAAERYSPEIAEAFQPTETERPATKKSPADFERPADQNPIATVMSTVAKEKIAIQGSTELIASKGFIVGLLWILRPQRIQVRASAE